MQRRKPMMRGHERFAHDEEDGDLDFEVTNLGQPERRRAGTIWRWAGRIPTQWRFAGTLGMLLLAMLIIVAGVDGAAAFQPLVRLFVRPPQPPVGLVFDQSGFTCLVDAAWSPRGQRAALLGYEQRCAPIEYGAGLVGIYDANSGKLLARLHPDAAILRALDGPSGKVGPSATGNGAPVILYQHVLWSADGRHLALTFDSFPAPGPPPALPTQPVAMQSGALVMDPNGKDARVVIPPQNTGVSSQAPLYAEWDLERGTLLSAGEAQPESRGDQLLPPLLFPPAPAYTWGANGTLRPEAASGHSKTETASAAARGPIGNPDGGASFTLWQPGWVGLLASPFARDATSNEPDVYVWYTIFTAWSPGGRYLADSIVLGGRLQRVGQPPAGKTTLAAVGASQWPLLAPRDAGLRQVLAALPPATSGNVAVYAVAWRPDGRVLAAYQAFGESTSGHPAPLTVNLYDCATGRLLASLTPQHGTSGLPTHVLPFLRWSPDGSHLLLLSEATGAATLWGPGQLPQGAGG
jgi:hypothetical protein